MDESAHDPTLPVSETPTDAAASRSIDLAPGTAVGEYEIEEKLGQGGFGSVYSAVHPVIGKR
ncbi:MAG: hypothetical protein AAGA56_28675, partial [Myxococcota bacterium]